MREISIAAELLRELASRSDYADTSKAVVNGVRAPNPAHQRPESVVIPEPDWPLTPGDRK